MSTVKPPLLQPVVSEDKLYAKFKWISTAPEAACARAMLNDVYKDFTDPDGNFVEQFQTTAFDARYFEFYLYAYLQRSGYKIDRTYAFPDFIVEKGGARAAVEATTTNPSTSGVLKDAKKIADLTPDELLNYTQNELAIRFGGPLNAKLRKRYWDQPQCAGLPLVFAIATFHDEDALGLTDNALMRYLYGTTTAGEWSEDGRLNVSSQAVKKHAALGKEIPSHFFGQPDTENISAILFTNSGTHAKFSRMGYQHGYETDEIEIFRFGKSYTMDNDAKDPTHFAYRLSEPHVVETWGQGLCVMHNPNAINPLPREFFVDAVQCYQEHGRIVTDHYGFHPFSSKTAIAYYHGAKQKMAELIPPLPPSHEIGPMKRDHFRYILAKTESDYSPSEAEDGWYCDAIHAFLGVILREGFAWRLKVYARDEFFKFFVLAETTFDEGRELAVDLLYMKIASYLKSPQLIFPGQKAPEPRDPRPAEAAVSDAEALGTAE